MARGTARSLMGRLRQRKAQINCRWVMIEANFNRLSPSAGLKLITEITPQRSSVSYEVFYDIGWKRDRLGELLEPLNIWESRDPHTEKTFVFNEDDEIHYKKRFAQWLEEQEKDIASGKTLAIVKTDQSPNIHARLFIIDQEAVEQLVMNLEKGHGGEWRWKTQIDISAVFHGDQSATVLSESNFDVVEQELTALQALAG